MKQYCRYCTYLCVNNFPYCQKKEIQKSESSCKRPNKCKDFVFADCQPEFQDAFGETAGYKPRDSGKHYKKQCENQMELFARQAGTGFPLDESCETVDTAWLKLPKANRFKTPPRMITVTPINDYVE